MHCVTAMVKHVGIDFGSAEITVAQLLLHRTNIRAGLQQVGGKAVSQRVATGKLIDIGLTHSRLDGSL